MNEQEFKRILEDAKKGEIMAIETILELYEPMVNKHAVLNGNFDEDLKQFLLLSILRKLKKFEV